MMEEEIKKLYDKWPIERLWTAACNGGLEELKWYYEQDSGIINRRYHKFDRDRSLIMGAYRNDQFTTVEYLLSVGETVTYEEQEEIDTELRRIKLLKRLGSAE